MQAQIDRNLFETAPRQECRDGVDVGDKAFHRQAGGHADNVLLGDAFHEKAIWHLGAELGQRPDAQIGSYEDDALIAPRDLMHHVERGLAHQPRSNAAYMAAISAALSFDLWCHAASFSAKGMPLP